MPWQIGAVSVAQVGHTIFGLWFSYVYHKPYGIKKQSVIRTDFNQDLSPEAANTTPVCHAASESAQANPFEMLKHLHTIRGRAF